MIRTPNGRTTRTTKRPERFELAIVAVQQSPDPAENRSFFPPSACQAWNRRNDSVGHPAERQRLQPHSSRALQCRKEQSFSAEQRRLDFADVLNLVIDGRLEADDAAGVDANQLAGRERAFLQCSAGMDESPAVSLEPLHDEALAAEQSDAKLTLERNPDADALCRCEE